VALSANDVYISLLFLVLGRHDWLGFRNKLLFGFTESQLESFLFLISHFTLLEHFNLLLLQDSSGLSFHFLLSLVFIIECFVVVGDEFAGGAASLPSFLRSGWLTLLD
jgi:hypothetical protein